MSNYNIPEIIQLPKPYINMDSSINAHLVDILNAGLDDLSYNSPERFSEDEILMMHKKESGYLVIDTPGNVDILYCETPQSEQFLHFIPPSSEGDLKVVPDERALKALNYIKDYYREDIIVYPYTIVDEDMQYEVYSSDNITTVVVYGNNHYLSVEDFVLCSQSAKLGEVIPQYFYEGVKEINTENKSVVKTSGYYDTGDLDDLEFPILKHIAFMTFPNN